jgi:hypothetical protein
MLLQNRDAFCYALVTDMCGRARYKPSDVIGLAAAKPKPSNCVAKPFRFAVLLARIARNCASTKRAKTHIYSAACSRR